MGSDCPTLLQNSSPPSMRSGASCCVQNTRKNGLFTHVVVVNSGRDKITIILFNDNSRPFCLRTSVVHISQRGAIIESLRTNLGNAIRNSDTFKTSTTIECIIPNACRQRTVSTSKITRIQNTDFFISYS